MLPVRGRQQGVVRLDPFAARGESQREQATQDAAVAPQSVLAEELAGTLRCAACRYDLRGLSVKGYCPECGLPIQATLLSIVDPMAEELQPIARPRLVASGLLAWSVGALVAALVAWFVWISGVSGVMRDLLSPGARERLIAFGAVALAFSGLGAAAIVRPHAAIPTGRVVAASFAVALYPVVVWLYVDLGRVAATGAQQSLLGAFTSDRSRRPGGPSVCFCGCSSPQGAGCCGPTSGCSRCGHSCCDRSGWTDRRSRRACRR
jgi:hypothetical protein